LSQSFSDGERKRSVVATTRGRENNVQELRVLAPEQGGWVRKEKVICFGQRITKCAPEPKGLHPEITVGRPTLSLALEVRYRKVGVPIAYVGAAPVQHGGLQNLLRLVVRISCALASRNAFHTLVAGHDETVSFRALDEANRRGRTFFTPPCPRPPT
jgi:hypothetical protein